MNRQRADKSEYRVRYGVDSNAALQPEYVYEPQRKQKPDVDKRKSKARAQKLQRKAEVAKYTAITMLVVTVAAMGFFVVTRNAEIYSNNRQIRSLANEKADLEVKLRTAEKDGSIGNEFNSYFEIAQDELQLTYPDESNIVTVVVPAATTQDEKVEVAMESNVFDTVLDWFGSLERRIKSWA